MKSGALIKVWIPTGDFQRTFQGGYGKRLIAEGTSNLRSAKVLSNILPTIINLISEPSH